MKNNISKFTQIDNTILLEYVINNFLVDDNEGSVFDNSQFTLDDNKTNILDWNVKNSNKDTGKYIVDFNSQFTNNSVNHICLPIDKDGIEYFEPIDINSLYNFTTEFFNNNLSLKQYYSNNSVSYDTIRLHILSGYSFEDLYGIFLKVTSLDNDKNIIHLSNWLYKNTDMEFHFEKPIIMNNKIFDKYIEFKIPSMQFFKSQILGDDKLSELINDLNVDSEKSSIIPNINITCSTISNDNVEKVYTTNISNNEIFGYKMRLDKEVILQIPYNSLSDNFNLYMSESTTGDYIEFYTTWCDRPLNSSIVSTFNTRFQLYETQKNRYMENIYDAEEDKNQWVVIHDIVASFYKNTGEKVIKIIPDERYSITQEFNYDENEKISFKYKPIITDNFECSNISYITFNYTARLINRIDGVQIIRYGSLTCDKPERYITSHHKLKTDNIVNYSIYNKIIKNEHKLSNSNTFVKNKYVKVFYNANDIFIDDVKSTNINNNELVINRGTSTYKLIFKKKNEDGSTQNINLNDMSSYIIVFPDENGKDIELQITYSSNMNLTLGELEFNLTKSVLNKLIKSKYRYFDVMVLNPDGSRSTMYEGKFRINE